jgi:hypothetical protein
MQRQKTHSPTRLRRTPPGWVSIAPMAVLLALPSLLADIAEEGRNIILIMLATGLVFISVIALGELSKWARHRRRGY